MFGSEILEVTIGVIFVFVLVAIICSAIREGVEAWLKTRAAFLEHGIRELLRDREGKSLATAFYEHPLINSLYPGSYTPGKNQERPSHLARGKALPSYIPARNFALALMDIAARGPQTDAVSSNPQSPAISLDSVRANIANLSNPFVQRALLSAIDMAQGRLDTAQKNIETWYDSSMDRVSGWYKRTTHWIVFWIGLLVAVVLNINTLSLVHYLYKNDSARTAIVAKAETAATDTAFLRQNYAEARAALDSLQLPIGWSAGLGAFHEPVTVAQQKQFSSWWWWNYILAPVLGWLITALAATMGAPFWFDLLNKVMVVRSTVKPHEKSPEEASEDRQPPRRPAPGAPAVVAGAAGGAVGSAAVLPAPAVAEATTAVPLGFENIRDVYSNIDGCDVHSDNITTDEQLPPAQGGVA